MMNKRIIIPSLVAVALVAGSALAAIAEPMSGSERALRNSERLTTAPTAESLNAGAYLDTYAEIKAYADDFAADMPLATPDSLDDVGYVAAAQQGGASTALLEFVMQYNARCDWYRAALEQPSDETAREVVSEIPRWAAFRGQATGGPVAGSSQRIADAVSQGDLSPLKAEVTGPACNNPLGATTG